MLVMNNLLKGCVILGIFQSTQLNRGLEAEPLIYREPETSQNARPFGSSMGEWSCNCKALVRSKKLAALALSWRICARARAHAQFFRDLALALALKTF